MKICPSQAVPAAHIGAIRSVFHSVGVLLAGGILMSVTLQAAQSRRTLQIVAFGDSLSAGFQLRPSDAFPAKLEAALKAKGHAVEIADAGVSGDTTAAGLQRIDWAVPDGTDIVILEFGANDMLRGLDPNAARANLDALVKRLQAKGATVLLTGMRSLGNWGADYAARFEAIFPDLAKAHGVMLYPFFLDGVVGRRELNLSDGMHPNAAGVDEIVRRIQPMVEQVIAQVRRAKPD